MKGLAHPPPDRFISEVSSVMAELCGDFRCLGLGRRAVATLPPMFPPFFFLLFSVVYLLGRSSTERFHSLHEHPMTRTEVRVSCRFFLGMPQEKRFFNSPSVTVKAKLKHPFFLHFFATPPSAISSEIRVSSHQKSVALPFGVRGLF